MFPRVMATPAAAPSGSRPNSIAFLTRLSDDTGDMGRNAAYYRTICPFTDVPKSTCFFLLI